MDFKVLDERKQIEHEVIKEYSYGSVVYETTTENSDKDFIVVVKSEEEVMYNVRGDESDYTIYSEQMFIEGINAHKVSILECIFQMKNDEYFKYFKLDTEKLRREFSGVSSNSYVKCKKKLRDGEVYIGQKSLFHSLRILHFGIQIAEHGKITDFTEANKYLKIIFDIGDNWEALHKTFKPIHNELKSKFKQLAQLDKERVNG